MAISSIAQTKIAENINTIDNMLESYLDQKAKAYIAPARKNLGVTTIALVREVIAPTVFRNEDAEPLTADVASNIFVRATPNKFKFGERARVLQILRSLEVGGNYAQNRLFVPKGKASGDCFDACSFLLGDSGLGDGRVLSATAAVKYTDALSLQPEAFCVDSTFHVRGSEQGTLFDEVNKKNTDNLFSRIYIQPGTLMIQTLTFTGKTAPAEIVDLLLTTLASPMAYGGQTSVTGVNVQTHIAGVFGGDFEVAENSPYVLLPKLLSKLDNDDQAMDVSIVKQALFDIFSSVYPNAVTSEVVAEIQSAQLDKIANREHEELTAASKVISDYFTRYFDK
ncbi:type I-D CRISPR-associated protein Csc2 [Photobacterium phosphoreum]|uniref:type I-D CRISPR-associated protein Csc2 n=1 Tax=Photobacterium phosphoreum TaxID=659 RepID=UPI000D184A04|nr:type I-D CRISPR-associated protein Csc2 [Photobacterium phosphoreum]PSU83546.1 type I-D CRISPR-associated protein Csc2 [Photobacterium phosphoreum]